MIDRFTEKAREAIQAAAELAAQLDHGYVGTEHLLLGLIREGTGVAAMILGHYGVTEEKVLSLMERLNFSGFPDESAGRAGVYAGSQTGVGSQL